MADRLHSLGRWLRRVSRDAAIPFSDLSSLGGVARRTRRLRLALALALVVALAVGVAEAPTHPGRHFLPADTVGIVVLDVSRASPPAPTTASSRSSTRLLLPGAFRARALLGRGLRGAPARNARVGADPVAPVLRSSERKQGRHSAEPVAAVVHGGNRHLHRALPRRADAAARPRRSRLGRAHQ